MRFTPAKTTRLATTVAAMAILASACGGGGGNGSADNAVDQALAEATGVQASSTELDSCTLVTDAEVSEFAGTPLVHSVEGGEFLGCGFSEDGMSMADLTVRGFTGEGSARDNAAEFSDNVIITDVAGVGDDAVAVTLDDNVNFLVAHQDGNYVELVMTFLDVPPGSPAFEDAKELANTALGRM
jgi:hypothetical protein